MIKNKQLLIGLFTFFIISGLLHPCLASQLESRAFTNPYGIAVNANGEVYVINTGENCIEKYADSKRYYIFLKQFGEYGTGDGQFAQPQGIAVSNKGFIYIVDTGNDRIQ